MTREELLQMLHQMDHRCRNSNYSFCPADEEILKGITKEIIE